MGARTIVLISMTVAAAASRLVPHVPNFTPILAVALFGAAHFGSRTMALFVPLAAMVLSDLALEVFTPHGIFTGWMAAGAGFHSGMPAVYLAVALTWLLGLALRKHLSVATITACCFAGSLQFYLVTNFPWWAGDGLYPRTAEGLVASYVAGLPFFGWTLAGTAYYAAILFGGFALAQRRYPELEAAGI
jgi:hypothetical protein